MADIAGLSVFARLKRQGRFEEFETGESGPRTSNRMPALRGFTRGALGVTGTRSPGAPQTRNPDAAVEKDRQTIQELLAGGL